jgi:hypothetical protein
MAFGSFTLKGEIDTFGDAPADGFVVIEGIPSTIVDADDNIVWVGPKRIPLDSLGQFAVTLPTNVTTGQSVNIGYRVSTDLKRCGNITPVEFYARPISSVVLLGSVATQVVELVADTTANRILAQQAASDAAGSAALAQAVGTTNDAVIAGRINTAGTASRAAVDARIDAHPSGVSTAQMNAAIAQALSQVPALGEQPVPFNVIFPGETDSRSYTSVGTVREVPLVGFLSPVTLLRIAFWFNGSVPASTTNYYLFSFEKTTSTGSESVICEQTTQTKAITTDTPWTIDVPFDESNRVFAEGEQLGVQITPTGNPGALLGPIIGTCYVMRA